MQQSTTHRTIGAVRRSHSSASRGSPLARCGISDEESRAAGTSAELRTPISPVPCCRMLGALVAAVLLCGPTLAVDPSAGPLFSIWHIEGHGYGWQLDQIAAGFPFEPSIRVPGVEQLYNAESVQSLSWNTPRFSKFNKGSIVLRMNNITTELDHTFRRIWPLTEDNWRYSFLCIRRLPETGKLDDTPLPCPFVSDERWAEAGETWALSPWLRRLQKMIPNPTSVILRENNEGARLSFDSLYEVVDGAKRWKSKAQLDAICLRSSEWVDTKRAAGSVEEHRAEFQRAETALYQALFAAFDRNLSESWRGKLRTVGYGGAYENYQHDAASPNLYMGWYRPAVLTDPAHLREWNDWRANWDAGNANPRAWRELSIRMRGPTLFEGAQQGRHDVVDPESFAAYMAFGMWAMQHPGREVRMTYWEGYRTRPDKLLLVSQPWRDAVTALGRSDLLTLTVGDYETAVEKHMARIHTNPILSRFWRDGTTQIIGSPQNDAQNVRVYATETTCQGEAQSLLYVYSPCSLTGPVQVGNHTLPTGFRRSAYYLTNPVQEVQ